MLATFPFQWFQPTAFEASDGTWFRTEWAALLHDLIERRWSQLLPTLQSKAQSGGVSPQTLSGMALQRQQFLEQMQKTDAATLANQKTVNDQLLGHIDAIRGISDPVKRTKAAQLQASQILNANLARDPQTQQLVRAIAGGHCVPTDDDLDGFEAGLIDHSTQIDQHLKQAQTGAEIAKAALDQANTFLAQNKANIIKQYQQNPDVLLSQVDAIAPFKQYGSLNLRTKSLVHTALMTGDIEGAQKAIQQASEQGGGIEKETNPQVIASRVGQATAEEQARVNVQNAPSNVAAEASRKKAISLATGGLQQVYATTPQGQTMLMTKEDAQNRGYGY